MQFKHYSVRFGGSAENRTPVRTRKPYVFYMLISALIFVMQQDLSHQLHPYPLKFHQPVEAPVDYSRFYSTADQNASGRMAFWAMSRSPAWQGN